MIERQPSLKQPLEDKLFDLRTPLGIPNALLIERVKRAHEAFEDIPGFIGIAINGSLTKGYSTSESDIDAKILYDSSLLGSEEEVIYMVNAVREQGKIRRFGHRYGGKYHFAPLDINPDLLAPSPESVSVIFQLITGAKINNYRHYWLEKLLGMSQESRDEFVGEMAQSLAYKDIEGWGWDKMTERMTGVSRGNPMGSLQGWQWLQWTREVDEYDHMDRYSYQKMRERLWRARIAEVLEATAAAGS